MDDPKELKKQQDDYEHEFSKKKKDYDKVKGNGEAKKPRRMAYQRYIMLAAVHT
jgi:hypothetical protein